MMMTTPLSPPCRPRHRRRAAVALVRELVVDDDNNYDDDAAFVPPCHRRRRRRAAAALVRGLVVALGRSLARALARGVFVIVLALAQNLFDDYDDNDDDDDAFVSPFRPRHHHRAATALVRGLVVALARSFLAPTRRGMTNRMRGSVAGIWEDNPVRRGRG